MKKRIIIGLGIITTMIIILISYKVAYSDKNKKEFEYSPPTYEICDENSCVYLLGSIHVGDDKVTKIKEEIIENYNKSKYLAVELDIQNIDIYTTIQDYLLDNGETIDEKITDELKEKLINFLEDKNSMYTYDMLNKFKLGFINSYITLLATMEMNMQESGVDNHFLTLAHEENKEIIELETYEEQKNLLLNYDDEIYIKQIEESIDNYEEIKKELIKLYESYINEDKKELEKLINGENEEREYTQKEKEYMEEMYDKRNEKMTEKVEKFLEEDKEVFIIVGAAHVIGNNGIIDLIKNKNYKIVEVK